MKTTIKIVVLILISLSSLTSCAFMEGLVQVADALSSTTSTSYDDNTSNSYNSYANNAYTRNSSGSSSSSRSSNTTVQKKYAGYVEGQDIAQGNTIVMVRANVISAEEKVITLWMGIPINARIAPVKDNAISVMAQGNHKYVKV